MEKQEVKSKWDELARQIGAEIDPEKEQLVEAAPQQSESALPVETAPKPRPPAPKRPAGWDNLANEFGLPAPEPAPESVVEVVAVTKHVVASEVPEVEAPRRERRTSDRPARERQERPRQRRDSRSRDQEEGQPELPSERARESQSDRPRQHRQEREQRGERQERGERQDRGRRPQRDRREQRQEGERRPPREERSQREHLEERGPRDQREEREEPEHRNEREHREQLQQREQREEREEPPKPAPAVSLWQKIFGSPVEPPPLPEAISFGDAAHAEEARGTSEREESRDSQESRAGEESRFRGPRFRDDEPQSEDRGEAPGNMDFEGTTEEGTSTEDRQRRPRRRRRGRGGRGERPAEATSDAPRRRKAPRAEEPAEDDDEFDEIGTADNGLDAELDDELAADAEDSGDGEGDQAGSGRSRSVLQRSIPSWDEAIGYIVDVNMQARSQRRPSSHSGPRSGPSRGRPPRGRRKK